MLLTLKEAYDVLQFEINWCLDNPDKTLTHDQQMGFVNGLRQAQNLLKAAELVVAAKRGLLGTSNTGA